MKYSLYHTGLFALAKVTRFCFRVRGLARLAEVIRQFFIRYPQTIIMPDFDGSLSLECRLNDHMASQIFWRGAYSEDQLRWLDTYLTPAMCFVDVGANIGEFTLFAARRLPAGNVLAFEPSPAIRRSLAENTARNQFANVRVFDCALGEHSGTMSLYGSHEKFSDGSLHSGLATLYPYGARQSPVADVPIKRLDDVMASSTRCDVIKIDVEGAELFVLRGAERILQTDRPHILLELSDETAAAAGYSAQDIIDFLAQHGYTIKTLGRDGRLKPYAPSAFQNIVAVPVSV